MISREPEHYEHAVSRGTLVEDTAKSYGDPGTRNMLIRGDNLSVMQALIEEGLAGRVDCAQIDPPYNSGHEFQDYSDSKAAVEWVAYHGKRIALIHELLSPAGFLLCHIDDTSSHHMRYLLDRIFGPNNYWATIHVNTKHRDPSTPDKSPWIHRSMEEVQIYRKHRDAQPFISSHCVPISDYIDGDILGDRSKEGGVIFRGGKKPEALIRFGFENFAPPAGLVLDAYLGSGTGAAVATKMNLSWIGICKDHMESHCLPRLKSVVDGRDATGISREVDWQGGGGFKYYDLVMKSAIWPTCR